MDAVSEHTVTAMPERRDGETRFRGRCSCGATSFMHYGTKGAAKTALRRTHLAESSDDETNKQRSTTW